ncbi:MAG TPA: hypothetical protein VLS25_08565 [Dehalococcoidia bacterium]|nr:hypothetical protein [Dehalococcoidia bacterium]
MVNRYVWIGDMRFWKVSLIAVICALLAAYAGGASGSSDLEASAHNARWEVRLRVAGEARAGEMITVDLSLKNVSDEMRRTDLDCVSSFGLIVLDAGWSTVFSWYDYLIETKYHGQVPECPPGWKDLAPGERLEQTVSFHVAEPGEYTVRALPPSETVGSSSATIALWPEVRVRAR